MHDDATFDAFYTRTAPDVARHVYLLTAGPHRAVHVTHRAYARAYAEWETVSAFASPESWVRMLASDMALDHLHRAGQRISGWIPHRDRIATQVAEVGRSPEPADAPAETPNSPVPPRSADEPDAPTGRPQPTKARDNRSKKKGRKPRQDRQDRPADAQPTPPKAETPKAATAKAGEPKAPDSGTGGPSTPAPTGARTADGGEAPVPDLSGDKSDAVDRAWSADVALLRALRRVPAHRRRAAVLRHHLGMTPEDIAVETEATTNSTIERISLANEQLSRRVGELTGPDPDGPEAHERLNAVMVDLTRRYQPKLRPAARIRSGARKRAVVLVAAVGAVVLGLGGYALSTIADPGGLPDKRARVQASIAARGGLGAPAAEQAPAPEFKFGRTNAKAEQVPQGQYEFVYIKAASEHEDGGTYLSVEAAHAGVDPEAIVGVREVPLAAEARFRGEKAFGITEERFVDPKLFLSRLAEGHLATTVFQIHYDDNNQIDRVAEYQR
ncbi:hypothetical protein [Yinghuangia sp. YIM S09857]|uniref:hypothetical protein n=1 Tax=Yinghuangia sp. YIM S09857 TaxID=3436929 RepID=UPI003F52BDBE